MADLSQAVAWHRQVAALVAAADRAGVATAELPTVRARLLIQQNRLTEEAARIGAALPALIPTPSEIAAVGPALGDLSEPAVGRTVRTMYSTLDAADLALGVPAPAPAATSTASGIATGVLSGPVSPVPPPPVAATTQVPGTMPGQPPGSGKPASAWVGQDRGAVARVRDAAGRSVALRNAAIYGGFAATVLAVQIALFILLDEENTLPLTGPLCLVVMPAFAWLAGYLTIGVAFRPPPGQKKVDRTPRLGAVICTIPDMLLLAAVVALFAFNTLAK